MAKIEMRVIKKSSRFRTNSSDADAPTANQIAPIDSRLLVRT